MIVLEKIIKILAVVVLGLVLINNYYALEVEGQDYVECSCSIPSLPEFVVKNDTSLSQTIEVYAEGDVKDWIYIGDKKVGYEPFVFSLSPGESTTLYAFVKPNTCYVKEGTYYLNLVFKTQTEKIVKRLEIKVKDGISFSINADLGKAKQCSTKELVFIVSNKGIKGEEILFNLDLSSLGYSTVQQKVYIDKDKSKKITAQINIPCSLKEGDYTVGAEVSIPRYEYSEKKNFELVINRVQNVSWTLKNSKICQEKPIVNIEIENKAKTKDIFSVSLDSQTKEFALEPGKKTNVSFELSKPFSDKYSLEIYSKNFDRTDKQEISFDFVKCYDIEIEGIKYDGKYSFCKSDLPKEIKIRVRNKGLVEGEFLIKSNLSFKPSSIFLDKGSVKTITGTIPKDFSSKSFSVILEKNGIENQKEFLVDLEDCYSLKIDYPQNIKIEKACDSQSYALVLKNTGKKEQKVKVEAEGPSWAHIKPQDVLLKAGEEKKIFIFLSPGVHDKSGKYVLRLKIKGVNFEEDKNINIELYGKINEESLVVNEESSDLITKTYSTLRTKFSLVNTSDAVVKISDLNIEEYDAEILPKEAVLEPGAKQEFTLKIDFGENKPVEDSLPVYLNFLANGEESKKLLVITLIKDSNNSSEITGEIEQENQEITEEIPSASTDENNNLSEKIKVSGVFGLGGLAKYGILLLIVLVLVAIVYFYLREDSGTEEKSE